MNGETSRRAFQAFLTILAGVALLAGATTVLLGAESIVGADHVSATVDSEMRFYAVWYVGAGFLLLWSVRNLDRARSFIRGVAGLLFVAGMSRGLSWFMVGEPHTVAQVLMVIELALPFVIVSWHAAVVRATGGSSDRSVASESR